MTPTTASGFRPGRSADGSGAARAGYRQAVWSEWTKLVTLRSTVGLTVALSLGLPFFSVIVAATGSLQPDDTVVGASVLGGAVVAQLLAGVLGALCVTPEFQTGTIRSTLAACPRRLVVLSAKATVVAAVVFLVALVSAVCAFAFGSVMLDSGEYATGEPWPALVGVALAIAAMGVLGVAIGTVVRHSAGAVIATVTLVLLPGMVAPFLGGAQRWVGGASLTGIMQKLAQSSDATTETVGTLGAWPSLVIVAGYTTAAVLAAVWVLRRRDT